MHVLKWIIANWHDILVGIVLIAAVITGITQWVKKKGPIFSAMSTAEKMAYITRLLTNLIPIALVLVTDAEIEYGGGTGQLKRSYVIDELYKRIPDEYKKYITEENLDTILNKALTEAKVLWESNEHLKKLIEGM
jgi:hypothetical protein